MPLTSIVTLSFNKGSQVNTREEKFPRVSLCIHFPESEWALFSTKGPIPSSIQELNTYIWEEWMETEGKEKGAKVNATIEVYSAGNPRSPEYESGIWIPVKTN